jgi:hypothetical protein
MNGFQGFDRLRCIDLDQSAAGVEAMSIVATADHTGQGLLAALRPHIRRQGWRQAGQIARGHRGRRISPTAAHSLRRQAAL